MKIEAILELWEQDGPLNPSDLQGDLANIAKLHTKYYKLYAEEKSRLFIYESEMNKLKKEKHEMFIDGASKEQKDKGWEIPQRKILKSDVPVYMDADAQIIEQSAKINMQKDKIDILKTIIKQIDARQYQVKYYMEAYKLKYGQ